MAKQGREIYDTVVVINCVLWLVIDIPPGVWKTTLFSTIVLLSL